jgi:hypothetical protein
MITGPNAKILSDPDADLVQGFIYIYTYTYIYIYIYIYIYV